MARISIFVVGVAVLFLLLVFVVSCSPAQAQPMPGCGPPQAMAERLSAQFGEKRIGVGQIANGLHPNARVLELFASGGGSWSILVTNQDRIACMIASGQRWQSSHQQEAGR